MSKKLNRAVLAACLAWACAVQALAADARVLLTREMLDEAEAYYLKKWNVPILVDGGVSMPLATGEEVTHSSIQMLANYLKETKQVPSLENLEPLLEDKSDACRYFCAACLLARIPDLPVYSPFFPPGSEPERIAKVKAAIAKAKEKEKSKGVPRSGID